MPLANRSTGKVLMEKVRIANDHWKRMQGLMFEKFENFNYALVFELERETVAGAAIHMLFVFFPIDVVYLDREKRVVDIALNLKPFSLGYSPKKAANYFIELPAGKGKEVKIGEQLDWA
ncbi:MAG: DUF192 domain-containing protein [Candidatus Diapherotrites archaeon]